MSEQLNRILTGTGELPEDGAAILDDVRAFIKRFCAFPDEHCLDAVTLWAAHTHMVMEFYTTPRLSLLSPEAASGKTRVLEILDLLCSESQFSLNPSPATIFRVLQEKQVTLLLDETDSIWNGKVRDDAHEDLRGLLNSGYRKGATIPRCVGPTHQVVNFNTYCAVALAGLGELPETILSRSLIIRMRRRAPHEHVESFRYRLHEAEGRALGERLSNWADNAGEAAGGAVPDLPHGIDDRPADIWEPLIAIADAAGGDWPDKARSACVALCHAAEDRRISLGIRLLSDIRILFGDADAMHSETIIEQLTTDGELESPRLDADAPWGDLRGKPLSKRQLASKLRPYNVRSQKVTIRGVSLQGYRRESLWDAWERNLPPLRDEKLELTELPESAEGNGQDSIPIIPDIPEIRPPEGGCLRCGGEGCAWCQNSPDKVSHGIA